VWIVYTDGYWINHADFGFKHRRDYLKAQIDMHESAQQSGKVDELINSAEAERHCLKSWFAELDANDWGVISTFAFRKWDEVHDYLKQEQAIVAKPNWGGAGDGIHKIENERELKNFRDLVGRNNESLALDYCFQPLVTGPEKRLWYVDGRCVGGRKVIGRKTPWSDYANEYSITEYFNAKCKEFRADREIADRLCKKSGLSIGSIDFIGKHINEINGAGTTFVQYDLMSKVSDARRPLIDYLISKVV